MLNLRSSRASQYRSATQCDQWLVKASRGQWNGLVGEGACHQAYWPEVNPGIPMVGGENQLLHIVLWPPNTYMWRLEDRSRSSYYFGTVSLVESGTHWLVRLAGRLAPRLHVFPLLHHWDSKCVPCSSFSWTLGIKLRFCSHNSTVLTELSAQPSVYFSASK